MCVSIFFCHLSSAIIDHNVWQSLHTHTHTLSLSAGFDIKRHNLNLELRGYIIKDFLLFGLFGAVQTQLQLRNVTLDLS